MKAGFYFFIKLEFFVFRQGYLKDNTGFQVALMVYFIDGTLLNKR